MTPRRVQPRTAPTASSALLGLGTLRATCSRLGTVAERQTLHLSFVERFGREHIACISRTAGREGVGLAHRACNEKAPSGVKNKFRRGISRKTILSCISILYLGVGL